VARELGTAQSLLHRWKKKTEERKIDPFPSKGRMNRKGDCRDNAATESFSHTIKAEVDSRKKLQYPSGNQDGYFWIYRRGSQSEARHSCLDYIMPDDFEKKNAFKLTIR